MAAPKNQRLVTEKRGFRVKPIKHPRYRYVVYRIADGRRVEQAYFQSERAANSHAYTENIRLKNEGLEGQILGPELRGQAIEADRRLTPYVRVFATPSIFTNFISSRKIRCGKSSSMH